MKKALFVITVFSLFVFTTFRQVEALTISNLSVGSGKTYQVVDNGLVNGALVYIDRGYTFSSIPAALQGETYIKTANDDKGSSSASFFSFEVDQAVTVYVAHDDFITTRPSWLSSFSDTSDNLITTDTTLSIFERSYSAGIVSLGGNEGSSQSMYSVAVVGSGGGGGTDVVPPTVTITSPTTASTHTTSSSNLDIGGTASDETGVTDVTWTNSSGGGGVASGTNNWSVSNIILQEGTNEITVIAWDAANNSDTNTLTVTYNKTGGGQNNTSQPVQGEYPANILLSVLTVEAGRFAVPSNKRLVIELISLQVLGSDQERAFQVFATTSIGGTPVEHSIGTIGFMGNGSVRDTSLSGIIESFSRTLYADPNTDVIFTVRGENTSSTPKPVKVTFSGRLIDVP